jgi:hypothetical protein
MGPVLCLAWWPQEAGLRGPGFLRKLAHPLRRCTPSQSKGVFCFCWGGRTGNRRFRAASRPDPALGELGKGPGRGPARFEQIVSLVDQSESHSVRLCGPPCECIGVCQLLGGHRYSPMWAKGRLSSPTWETEARERPRPGPCSICSNSQPGRPIPKPFREIV